MTPQWTDRDLNPDPRSCQDRAFPLSYLPITLYYSTPSRNRTCAAGLRSPALYSAELQGHIFTKRPYRGSNPTFEQFCRLLLSPASPIAIVLLEPPDRLELSFEPYESPVLPLN